MKIGLINMGIGVLIAVVGIAITAVSYAAVSHSGGTYFVAWGAVVVGAWRFMVGLYQLLRGTVAGPVTASQMVSQTASAPPQMGLTAPPPRSDPDNVNVPGAMSPAVRIIGGVLIAQAAFRLISLVLVLLQARAAFFNYPQFVLTTIVAPAILFALGLTAGILILQRAAIARVFGLVFCSLGLLYQLYGIASVLYAAAKLPTFHMVWWTWIIIPIHIAIYVAGLIILARAPSGEKVVG